MTTNQSPAEALRQAIINAAIFETKHISTYETGMKNLIVNVDRLVEELEPVVTAYAATVEREAANKREVYPTYYLYKCPNGIHEFELTEVCTHCLAALQGPQDTTKL